jgi:galactokinase
MLNQEIYTEALQKFRDCFNCEPTVQAYAPGRIEVLGNHTDYNEGLVLSAAIDFGTFFLAAPTQDATCRLVAGDIMEEAAFTTDALNPRPETMWANYVKGVLSGLMEIQPAPHGFVGLFLGNIPLGSGLSSSAALEMASGLALASLYNMSVDRMTMARIGQRAEHEYAGVKCGLLDQISSLAGTPDHLVMSDFRSLDIQAVPLGHDMGFLMCNTNAKHALVDGAYNERRHSCEAAASFFNEHLGHPVTALRDVTSADWQRFSRLMDPNPASRSAHVIGETERVKQGAQQLKQGDIKAFGQLMFDSHQSSIENFENSCPELDVVVEACRSIPEVLGARLSGGGFGGSVVILARPEDAALIANAITPTYEASFGHPCDVRPVMASTGAHLID